MLANRGTICRSSAKRVVCSAAHPSAESGSVTIRTGSLRKFSGGSEAGTGRAGTQAGAVDASSPSSPGASAAAAAWLVPPAIETINRMVSHLRVTAIMPCTLVLVGAASQTFQGFMRVEGLANSR